MKHQQNVISHKISVKNKQKTKHTNNIKKKQTQNFRPILQTLYAIKKKEKKKLYSNIIDI